MVRVNRKNYESLDDRSDHLKHHYCSSRGSADRPCVSSGGGSTSDGYGNQRMTNLLERPQWQSWSVQTKQTSSDCVTLLQGSVNAAQVRIAEVFKEAVRANAPAIAIAHNHPSGDPTPSSADVTLTLELSRAAGILDIDLIDHLIIGDGRWVSLRRLGLGFPAGT